jgi:hypothetical protein
VQFDAAIIPANVETSRMFSHTPHWYLTLLAPVKSMRSGYDSEREQRLGARR